MDFKWLILSQRNWENVQKLSCEISPREQLSIFHVYSAKNTILRETCSPCIARKETKNFLLQKYFWNFPLVGNRDCKKTWFRTRRLNISMQNQVIFFSNIISMSSTIGIKCIVLSGNMFILQNFGDNLISPKTISACILHFFRKIQ